MKESVLWKTLLNVIWLPPFLLSVFIPRRKNLWVFGAWLGHRYSDNSRYVFEYVRDHEPDVRAVWLASSKRVVEQVRLSGGEAYLSHSPKGYWMSCRAEIAFMTTGIRDMNRTAITRAKKVNLWHGSPLRKIGLDDLKWENPNKGLRAPLMHIWRTVFPYVRESLDVITSAGPAASKRFVTAFGVAPSQVHVTGYARADMILNARPAPIPAVEDFREKWNAQRIAGYFPTHRGAGDYDLDLFAGLDVEKLNKCLERHNAIMLVKMHFVHRQHHSFITGDSSSLRISWLAEHELDDLNLLLPHIDVLITDYSSVYFDYLLLNRPIIFAPLDMDRYVSEQHELYEDYDSVTPGPKCYNWDQIINQLDLTLEGTDLHCDARKEIGAKYNSFVDTENCRRIVEMAKRL